MSEVNTDWVNDAIQDASDRDHTRLMEMCAELDEFALKIEKYKHVVRCMDFADDLSIQFLMGWDELRREPADDILGSWDIDEAADAVLVRLGLEVLS